MSKVGSWVWAEQTGGRLRRRDRAALLRQALVARIELLPRPWRRELGTELNRMTVLEPPDSAIARAAEERVLMISEPVLYAHCLRTWAFATLFAKRDGITPDPELLYLACILHDLGLTATHDRRDSTAHCFAVEGARAARCFLVAHDVPEPRVDTIAESISLHLNVTVPAELGAEAALLSKGAALDAVGRYAHQLSATDRQGVLLRWPRAGFAGYLAKAAADQARRRPRSRSALLARFGFADLAAANPLDR